MSVYSWKISRERRENQDECGSAGHVEDEPFAGGDGISFSVKFELPGVPVLSKLTDGFYEVSDG